MLKGYTIKKKVYIIGAIIAGIVICIIAFFVQSGKTGTQKNETEVKTQTEDVPKIDAGGVKKTDLYANQKEHNSFIDDKGDVRYGIFKDENGDLFYADYYGVISEGKHFDEKNNKWVITDKEGKVKLGWVDLDKNKYYGDEKSGTLFVGCKKIDNKLYFFLPDGKLHTSGFISDGNKTYRSEKDGKLTTGWRKGMYFGKEGIQRKGGWYKFTKERDNSKGTYWVYFNEYGMAAKNTTIKENGKEYKVDKDGKLQGSDEGLKSIM